MSRFYHLVHSILNFLHAHKLKLEETGVTSRVYKLVKQPEGKASSKRYSSNIPSNLKWDLSMFVWVCLLVFFWSLYSPGNKAYNKWSLLLNSYLNCTRQQDWPNQLAGRLGLSGNLGALTLFNG